MLALSVAARRLPTEPVFVAALFGSGISLILVTAVSSLTVAVVLAGVFGLFAGTGYVSGFTIIQERVDDALRGRMFATLYTIIRFCLLMSLAVSPWMASLLDSLSRRAVRRPGDRRRVPALRAGGAADVLARRAHDRAGRPRGEPRHAAGPGPRSAPDQWRARPAFVVLEGGDGCGKSTQAEILAARLRGRRPGGGAHPGAGGDRGRAPGSGPWSSAGATSTPGPRRC